MTGFTAVRRDRASSIGVVAVVMVGIAILWLIAGCNAGLYPVVLSDECRYSLAARLRPFAESNVPLVFGNDPAGVHRTLFQRDDAGASAALLGADAMIGPRDWPASGAWAIVVGRHRLEGTDVDRNEHDGFVLLHRRAAR